MTACHLEDTVAKLAQLPAAQVAEVNNFIDFLRLKQADRAMVRAAMSISESRLESVWNNDDDADYDRL